MSWTDIALFFTTGFAFYRLVSALEAVVRCVRQRRARARRVRVAQRSHVRTVRPPFDQDAAAGIVAIEDWLARRGHDTPEGAA